MADRSQRKIYELEEFRLDASHLMLYRNTQEIALPPKAVETLLALIERHGEILHKDELMEIIWTDSIVEESNLSQYLHILRKALGKKCDGKPFIETLRRRGYRFTADIKCCEQLKTENLAVSDNISNESRLRLSKNVQETDTYTPNSEAQQLYLKGRFYRFRGDIKSLEKAVGYFKRAIEKDPNNKLAYTGLANTYIVIPNLSSLMPCYGNFRPKEYMPQAKQAVLKALKLDENLAEAHKTLGQILLYDYDWTGAEREFKKAIELDPNYANAYLFYGIYLSMIGKHVEAIAEISKALKLDLLSFGINRNRGQILRRAKRYDEAITQMKQLIEFFPNEESARYGLADAFAAKKMYDEAVEQYLIGNRLSEENPESIQKIEDAYEKDGWKGFLVARLESSLKEKRHKLKKDKNAFIPSGHYIKFFALLKDKNKTLKYLNKAYEQRETNILDLKDDFHFGFLRDEPKFRELVKKSGIPE